MTEGQSKFYTLLGRALTDRDFLDALTDPEQQRGALESMEIEPTQEVVDALNDSIGALNRLADTSDGNHVAVA